MCQCSTLKKVSHGVRGVDFSENHYRKTHGIWTPLSKTHVFLIGRFRFCCKTRAFWSVENRTWPPQNVTWPASEPAQPSQPPWPAQPSIQRPQRVLKQFPESSRTATTTATATQPQAQPQSQKTATATATQPYLQAWILKKSHIHRPGYGQILISAGLKDLIFAGLDMENKYHIRRPGYRKHLISAGLDMEKNSYPQA